MRAERNLLIPVEGGAELAADLLLPDEPGPVPVLVSHYPYHKDDVIAAAFEYPNRYFVERGYASVLVDFRGLGSSSGLARDAMDADEVTDCVAIVDWAAAQPWCDGNVGMWGVSYGGITAFRAAAENPPALKAVIPIYGSLDIYHDWFYPGGCFNCLGASGVWGSTMLAMQLMPPMHNDPEGRWYRVWTERLESAQPYLLPWREHPTWDDYWQSKTIDASRIEVPTFLIGGWRDIFPEAMVKAYNEVRGPRRLLMGPWLHLMPDLSPEAPTDFLPEMCRWWDCWLRGQDNGVALGPPVTHYVQGADEWRQEQEWPPPETADRGFYLAEEWALQETPPSDEADLPYESDPTIGTSSGLWDPIGLPIAVPLEQSHDDARSLSFTTEALSEDLEIAGSPNATLSLALDEGAEVNVVVKLCDVAPTGHSTLITSGWLKGSHRDSHESPKPLVRDEACVFDVSLWATAYRIVRGHRLRVSVSCSDFPRIWPTRTNPCIRLFAGGERPSHVRVPIAPAPASPLPELAVPDPEINRGPLTIDFEPRWRIERDVASKTASVTSGYTWKFRTPADDGAVSIDNTVTASVAAARPDGARVTGTTDTLHQMPDGSTVTVEARSLLTQSGLSLWGRVEIDGQPFFEREWRQ